jgi:hypothetical protein
MPVQYSALPFTSAGKSVCEGLGSILERKGEATTRPLGESGDAMVLLRRRELARRVIKERIVKSLIKFSERLLGSWKKVLVQL